MILKPKPESQGKLLAPLWKRLQLEQACNGETGANYMKALRIFPLSQMPGQQSTMWTLQMAMTEILEPLRLLLGKPSPKSMLRDSTPESGGKKIEPLSQYCPLFQWILPRFEFCDWIRLVMPEPILFIGLTLWPVAMSRGIAKVKGRMGGDLVKWSPYWKRFP